MFVVFLSFIIFSAYFFVEAHKSALSARYWGLVGFFLGPMALPLFFMAQHVAMRKAAGYNNLILKA